MKPEVRREFDCVISSTRLGNSRESSTEIYMYDKGFVSLPGYPHQLTGHIFKCYTRDTCPRRLKLTLSLLWSRSQGSHRRPNHGHATAMDSQSCSVSRLSTSVP
ncbi:hypothetical protein YC2023_090715 [Brassica napus]